jgi:LysR family transcriptional regulator, glycine cleavage system transcriptional activator
MSSIHVGMRRLPPLASLRAFEAAARHMSFKKAAEELAVTPTAISHQIKLLEEILGLKLFERRIRHVMMTEAGQQLLPPLREGFDLMAGAVKRIAAHRAHPSVVITTTTAFAAHWLIPRLATFRQRHPEIALSVLASDDIINLEAGKADLAIRLSSSRPAEREAKPLFSDRFTLVASPTLKVTIAADLERTPLIEFDWHRPRDDMPSWPKWLTAAGLDRLALSPQLRFNEESHAFQAAIAGQGVALFSLTIAGDALRRGILVQPFDTTIPGQTYYLVRGRSPVGSPVDAVSAWILGETVAEANAPSSAIIAGDHRNVSGSVAG